MEVAVAFAAPQTEVAPQAEPTAQNDYETERGKPMPSTNHAAIQLNLGVELKVKYGKKLRFLSELSLDLNGKPSVPDLSAYPFFPLNLEADTIRRTDPPLLTVEILSPTQALTTLVDKAAEYLQAGVVSAWVVIPEMEAIAVYHAPGKYDFFKDDDLLKDPKTGIEIPLAQIFQ